MKTIQLIIEAAILLSLIVVCVLLAGKRTVAVDGDVQLSHSQVSDIVDAIEEAGSSEATVKIDKVQMGQLVAAIGGGKWEVKRESVKFGQEFPEGWEPVAGVGGTWNEYVWIRKRIK